MDKKILHVEDVEGNDFEFELTLPEAIWKDYSKLYDLGRRMLMQHHRNENDITNIEVLTIN